MRTITSLLNLIYNSIKTLTSERAEPDSSSSPRGINPRTKSLRAGLALGALGLIFALPVSAHPGHGGHGGHRPYPPPRPAPQPDWPQESRGWDGPSAYAEIEMGIGGISDATVHGPFVDGDLNLDPAFVTGGAIGAQLTPFLRVEASMNYREAQVDSFVVQDFVSQDEGHFGAFATMGSMYLDLAIPNSPVTPFVGGGIGLGVVYLDAYDPFEDVDIDDESLQLAWNLSAGASWHLSNRVDLVTKYRYFATENLDEDYKDGTLRLGEADFEMDSHEAVIGVRFKF